MDRSGSATHGKPFAAENITQADGLGLAGAFTYVGACEFIYLLPQSESGHRSNRPSMLASEAGLGSVDYEVELQAHINGKHPASVHDFHSLRMTWITPALAAGVPLELVQRVTGHRIVEVVMKHYFRPGGGRTFGRRFSGRCQGCWGMRGSGQ